jgi:glucose/arabinose dehydrogenase
MRLIAVAAIAALFATTAAAQAQFQLELVTDDLSQPLFVTAPAGDPRLFVVEQGGAIRIIEGGTLSEGPFLNIRDLISLGGERGLLGLAFHPDYASNGRFYVNYTDRRGDTRVVGYTVSSDDPNRADPDSAEELLFVDQPRSNHNGGWIAFGPDGLLYVGMGDGGGGGDPNGNGQSPDVLLGKILRLDVDAGGDPQVFAMGARNPWRNAFDGDDLYVADVGQGQWEEIHVIPATEPGANLGWNIMEGTDCFRPIEGCDQSGLDLPIHTYSHDEGCSITGGYVYRGEAIPAIAGHYFFADYCAGVLWSLRYTGEGAADVTSYADSLGVLGNVTSFGLDSAGEMYVMTQDGKLMKFMPAS